MENTKNLNRPTVNIKNMNEQEKTQPQCEGVETSGERQHFSEEYYLIQAMNNLQLTSRTAKGVIDISASPDKGGKIHEGLSENDIINTAKTNFSETIRHLYNERDRQFKNSEELRL